ncbi:paraquat-inducible protein A [Thalassotalea nanhaiensis]|uniref:Paraquat-inducible protein A n=1 Tax=Thalassotalea nanhaiensis TaxID=3065648 RepID=A0ABY9TFF4_9GAMM|nr:paraquat-inducible protein A [Colwelliaceae bacterium SQ345]
MANKAMTASLGSCPRCHKLNVMKSDKQRCSRCHFHFHLRKPNSMQFTLAWTIAALIMFIPANTYPMMVFYSFGNPDASTILQGIAIFIQLGMLPVAVIIFIASFIVPLGKIIGLFVLMYNVKRKDKVNLKQQGKLYHLVEFLGPWSMLDVFVVAIMAAVVNLGFITSIEADSGITYFSLMVIFTMFAAESFDPRLLWDNKKVDNNK